MQEKKTLVVNLFGAPGSGKSTAAAYIFALLKMAGINAELVTEFAKDKVWEEAKAAFENQQYLFGEQSYRMSRCMGKVDVIVTDSPLLLSVIYNPKPDTIFNNWVRLAHLSQFRLNYYINRVNPFVQSGRIHNESESLQIGERIKDLLNETDIEYTEINSTKEDYEKVANEIINSMKTDDERCEEIANKIAKAIKATEFKVIEL